ncbi:epoxide hydrolase family protein [Quadrisphaera sp. DSM 44207]|uniref:epoxide hydrolase family protein n=1 Tax=Quadrisphaera sp. DSM 44207 TaxID=1881057 RepID=UPI0008921F27|nr:epoxide hydrolase family protein [Quadrisphaera sp. DSM 44207]SDQ37134.1 epoxide hydrolase [Quadrisphaera sp. DSM 44207]
MTQHTADPLTGQPDGRASERVAPFHLAVPEEQLADLRRRLAATRWPDRETVPGTSQGPQLAEVQALVRRWATGYDWRPAEALLNGLGQSTTTIDGPDVHFLHVRSPLPGALPLVMTHGWPGSVLEFRKVVGPLTDPVASGGSADDAFDLVIPSLPGFGFSGRPTTTGWDLCRTARAWITLMHRLGHARWGAQGGDLGAGITEEMAAITTAGDAAATTPTGLVGIHLNTAMSSPTPEEVAQATAEEAVMLQEAAYYWQELSGYAKVQSTRPQTIGYSLADFPAGLAAWLYAMFQDVGGSRGNAEAAFDVDEMIDDIMLYWLPNTGASAARMYWEMTRARWSPAARVEAPVAVPTGITVMPGEYVRTSRRWAERRYSDLVHFDQLPAGGHLAALEQPDALVEEVRTTFRGLR